MNKLLIIIVVLLISINMFSQNNYKDYYKLRNTAMEYHAMMNYDIAIKFYNEAFNSAYPFPDDMKLLYDCYIQIKDFKKANLALKKMILCGYKLKNDIPLIGSRNFNKIIENDANILNNNYLLRNYDNLRIKYLKNINNVNNQYLKSIEICEIFASKSRSFVKEDTICDNFYIVQEATFNLKNELLLALLKSDIDISRSSTDSWLDDDFILAIIHTSQSLDDEEINDFMDLLWQQVLNGNIIAEQYAVIEDWLFYRKNNISRLGVQLAFEDDKIVELYDYKNIDKFREEKLLPPLWVYCKLKGIELPKNYIYDFNIDR
jgi:hypothetical protein